MTPVGLPVPSSATGAMAKRQCLSSHRGQVLNFRQRISLFDSQTRLEIPFRSPRQRPAAASKAQGSIKASPVANAPPMGACASKVRPRHAGNGTSAAATNQAGGNLAHVLASLPVTAPVIDLCRLSWRLRGPAERQRGLLPSSCWRTALQAIRSARRA